MTMETLVTKMILMISGIPIPLVVWYYSDDYWTDGSDTDVGDLKFVYNLTFDEVTSNLIIVMTRQQHRRFLRHSRWCRVQCTCFQGSKVLWSWRTIRRPDNAPYGFTFVQKINPPCMSCDYGSTINTRGSIRSFL